MADTKKPEYKGPGEAAAALGQSQVDGYVAGAIGAGAGAIAGAALHDEKKMEKMINAAKTLEKAGVSSAKVARDTSRQIIAKAGSGVSEEALETAVRVVRENGPIKQFWHEMGRGGKALAASVAGLLVIGTIGNLVGVVRGQKKAEAGRRQFEALATENTLLQEKLAAANTQLAENKSFVASLQAERGKPASTEASRG